MLSYIGKLKNNSKGFTLLEVLIAVSIIAIVFTVLIKLNINSLVAIEKSGTINKLVFLCKKKMDEVQIKEYPDLGSEDGEFEEYPGFKWSMTVSEFGVENVRKINLIVTSPGGDKQDVLFYKAQ